MVSELKAGGWRLSQEQVQFRNTVCLDLAGDEADWLARMKQKARYNLRLAQKKGVQVRAGAAGDLPMLYRMYAETSVRDGFVIRDEGYYLRLWEMFIEPVASRTVDCRSGWRASCRNFCFLFCQPGLVPLRHVAPGAP